jgi:hypothetical protein
LNRTITYRYRTVGSRPPQRGINETLKEDTLIQARNDEGVGIGPDTGHTAVMSNERTHSARMTGGWKHQHTDNTQCHSYHSLTEEKWLEIKNAFS